MVKQIVEKCKTKLLAETGSSTIEYALIIIAAATFAGVLIAIIKSDAVHSLLEGVIMKAFGDGE